MHHLCDTDQLPDNQSKGFTVNGRSILAVKKYGEIHIYVNSCPHLGIQMEMVPDQFLDATHSLIMCSMHGALFTIDEGLCISGPCFDQKLKKIPFTIRDHKVFIDRDVNEHD